MVKEEFVTEFRAKKNLLKEYASKVMLSNMIADNIRDLFDNKWQVKQGWNGGITICPKENIIVTADVFDKMVIKLTKVFRKTPYIHIDENAMGATFYLYVKYNNQYCWKSTYVSIVTTNTEKCEVITKTTMQEVTTTELTGYCKVLAEKNYMEYIVDKDFKDPLNA